MLLLPATLALAAAAPPPSPPLPHGCVAPHDNHPWCNASLPAAQRAALVVAQLTVPELVANMQGDSPAIERLGIPAYHCAPRPPPCGLLLPLSLTPAPPPPPTWVLA